MNYDVPLAIIRAELNRIPPVRVECPVREASDLSPQVHPAVQKPKKAHDKKTNGWEHEMDYGQQESIEVHLLFEVFNVFLAPHHVKQET